jgi:MFS transporter, FHS family, glucose/mannose:H+ symporter
VIRTSRDNAVAIGVLGCVLFVLIGWTGLLAPSLIRSIEADLQQTDTAIGFFYFLYGAAYATGSLGGGYATERFGRRTVLTSAIAIHGLGVLLLGVVPVWAAFLASALPAGLGAGGIDGGMNGLFLDLFRAGRGRALNSLHLFFSVGAFIAPLVIGRLVDAGVEWRLLFVATGLVILPIAAVFAVLRPPHGRHAAPAATDGRHGDMPRRLLLRWPLPALALAIGAYVASEVGVSNWLVRFLGSAPIVVATGSLSLFWAGLAVGRLVSARISDRFDHVRFTVVWTFVASCALVGAVVAPVLPVSIALFGVVGFAFGPIFPMIIAIGGERFPERSAAVGGLLTGAAVVGGVVYPPVMGPISDTVGLPVAMFGTALLGFVCAVGLFAARGAGVARVGEPHPVAADVDRF